MGGGNSLRESRNDLSSGAGDLFLSDDQKAVIAEAKSHGIDTSYSGFEPQLGDFQRISDQLAAKKLQDQMQAQSDDQANQQKLIATRDQAAATVRNRAGSGGFSSTILTSPMGLSTPATTSAKTLLGQ